MKQDNIYQLMSDSGINPFAAQLLCESFLKSPMAEHINQKGEPLKFFFPINRGDTPDWYGVQVTLTPIKK